MPRKYKVRSFRLCHCGNKWRCQCLIRRKKKPHPPFNSGTKPDNKLGLHPDLRALPPASPAVGSYDYQPIDRKPGIINWKKQQEAERFFAAMSSKPVKEIMFQKNFMKTVLGPGIHEIPRWPKCIWETLCKSSQRDVSFGTVPQFEPSYKSTTPGPGYTLRTHNPYYYLDQKRLKGFTCVPSFEFDGLAPRFREIRKSWSLPCNRYRVKHPDSLQVFLDKVTSKRGPYDLLTGPRDETTIKGYWAGAKLEYYGDWPQKLPSEIDKLSSKSNYFKGRWSTDPRFSKKPVTRMMLQDVSTCYRDPNEPGPGHYNPQIPRKPSSLKKYPFHSNIEYARPLPPSSIHPGPGRYKIKEDYRIKGCGWVNVFNSKVPRTIGAVMPPQYNEF